MKLLPAVCLVAPLRFSQSFRIVRSDARKTIECVISAENVDWDGDGEAEDLFGRCTTADKESYLVDFTDVKEFQYGDVVSMQIEKKRSAAAANMSQEMHHATNVKLISRPSALMMSASASEPYRPSVLVVETIWSDYRAKDPMSEIRSASEKMRDVLIKNSNGLFVPSLAYTTLRVPKSFGAIAADNCHAGKIPEALEGNQEYESQRQRYTYVILVIPDQPVCGGGWSGVATQSCGRPEERKPTPTDCWVVSRAASWSLFAHELGHNLGFLHATGQRDFQGDFHEYGDPNSIMGASGDWNLNQSFNVAMRHDRGWVKEGPGGVLRTSRGVHKVGDLENPSPQADGVAIMMACDNCWPKPPNKQDEPGGLFFVSNMRWKDRVAVHFQLKGHIHWGHKTELRAYLHQGESYVDSGHAVYVCDMRNSAYAVVAVGGSVGDAKAQCPETPPPTPAPTPRPVPPRRRAPSPPRRRGSAPGERRRRRYDSPSPPPRRRGSAPGERRRRRYDSPSPPSPPSSKYFVMSSGGQDCPSGKSITQPRGCWQAARALSFPQASAGSWRGEISGCVLQGGKVWFNHYRPSARNRSQKAVCKN